MRKFRHMTASVLIMVMMLSATSNAYALSTTNGTPERETTSLSILGCDLADDSLKCWVIGKATKRLLKEMTDWSRKDIRKVRNAIVALCNELEI